MVEEDHAFEMNSVSRSGDRNVSENRQASGSELNTRASSAGFFVAAAICFLLWVGFLAGWQAAMLGMSGTAICRVLALGRFVLEQRALPATDPFSYTFALQHLPYVDHQWLSEIILFSVYKIDQLKSLIPFQSVLTALTFVCFPLILFMRTGASLTLACLYLTLALTSASGSFSIKPEIFSFLLLFAWLGILWKWRVQFEQSNNINDATITKRDWRCVIALFGVMLFWSNLHATFLLGFLTLALLLVSEVVGVLSHKKRRSAKLLPLVLGWIAALSASLLNPSGIQLWIYVPTLFLSPINQYVRELQPVAPADFGEPQILFSFLSFFTLSIVSIFYLFKELSSNKDGAIAQPAAIYSGLAIGLAMGATFLIRGAIAFATIVLLCEAAFLMRNAKMENQTKWVWLVDFDKQFRRIMEKRLVLVLASIVLLSLHGAYTAMAQKPPSLPEGSKNMRVPADALKVLCKQAQSGKVLNDANYGDILIWYFPRVMPVFIDTRYHMYGPSLVNDYRTITSCGAGTEQLLDKYDFDWAFFPAQAPISRYLRARGTWSEVYDSPIGSIFRHNTKN